MRGGSQSHMVAAEDGYRYVVKVKENAQHRRILINEWVASLLLKHLDILSAEARIIEFGEDFLARYPEVSVQVAQKIRAVSPGWHFGSRVPVDPDRFAIYDFLPDALLRQVANHRDFLGVLVFDKWAANADTRQCIFFQAQVRDWIASQQRTGRRVAMVAMMMDHGYVFSGPSWRLEDSPVSGLYSRAAVYESVTSLESFQPWLDRVLNLPPEVIDEAYRQIPEEWLDSDREELDRLLEAFWRRRKRIAHLVEDVRSGRVNPFPNWR